MDPQAEVINVVCEFLSGKGVFPHHSEDMTSHHKIEVVNRHSKDMTSHHKIEMVNRQYDFPVTIRFQFLGGQFCGSFDTGSLESDLLNPLCTCCHVFDLNDPGFFDQVFEFAENPYSIPTQFADMRI